MLHKCIDVVMTFGNIWYLIMCNIVNLPFVEKRGIYNPGTVWDDFVNPATMPDGFTSKRHEQ